MDGVGTRDVHRHPTRAKEGCSMASNGRLGPARVSLFSLPFWECALGSPSVLVALPPRELVDGMDGRPRRWRRLISQRWPGSQACPCLGSPHVSKALRLARHGIRRKHSVPSALVPPGGPEVTCRGCQRQSSSTPWKARPRFPRPGRPSRHCPAARGAGRGSCRREPAAVGLKGKGKRKPLGLIPPSDQPPSAPRKARRLFVARLVRHYEREGYNQLGLVEEPDRAKDGWTANCMGELETPGAISRRREGLRRRRPPFTPSFGPPGCHFVIRPCRPGQPGVETR